MLRKTRILHVLRAPVGGLFRHVQDLAREQTAAGHDVGIVCADTGNALTNQRLDSLAAAISLGVERQTMGRDIGLADWRAWRSVETHAHTLGIDILHGHGAKGGAYARLAARGMKRRGHAVACFYTPHGGSLHYPPRTLAGRFYGALERHLERYTDGILFESAFARDRYVGQIGAPATRVAVVPNGVLEADFTPAQPAENAADFLYIGELRMLKGVDVLIDALAALNRTRSATATIVGDGPDRAHFEARAASAGLVGRVTFTGALPAREAFRLGRALVVPSRAESFPYVVLEAAAAGLPLIATRVGGIPEIVTEPALGILIGAGDADALADAMALVLDDTASAHKRADALRASVGRRFTAAEMARRVTAFYGLDVPAARHAA